MQTQKTDISTTLEEVVKVVTSRTEPEFIILYGSYARGDAVVSDVYREGHITYEYESDLDILVLVNSNRLKNNHGLWNDIENELRQNPAVKGPVSLIVDTVDFVNDKVSEGNYFYSDIRREGQVLFSSGKSQLANPGAVNEEQRKKLAQEDWNFWLSKAEAYLTDFQHNMQDKAFSNAAFHLHQALEAVYVGALLVFTGYKPKTHDLIKIEKFLIEALPEFSPLIIGNTSAHETDLQLLRRAYVDARYSRNFQISAQSLQTLYTLILQKKVELTELCNQKLGI